MNIKECQGPNNVHILFDTNVNNLKTLGTTTCFMVQTIDTNILNQSDILHHVSVRSYGQ